MYIETVFKKEFWITQKTQNTHKTITIVHKVLRNIISVLNGSQKKIHKNNHLPFVLCTFLSLNEREKEDENNTTLANFIFFRIKWKKKRAFKF